MIVYAAIDIRAGRAVQLVGGKADQEMISWPDPVAVARRWISEGFRALHVVDLDAALGTGDNGNVISDILAVATVPVQVSGGVREEGKIASLLERGASCVVVGTRAIEDPTWRAQMTQRYARCIAVAADVRNGTVVKRGWTEDTGINAEHFVASLADEPLVAVMMTDVGREGSMAGVDVKRFSRVVEISPHPIIAAGGIRDNDDLRALAAAGVAGAIVGMALYTGNIQPEVTT